MNGKLRNMTSLYITAPGRILCLYRIGSRVANQMYIGSAGGHFEPEELNDARACVLREAQEELGLTEADLDGLALRYITLRLKNGEIRQNYYFFATLKDPTRPLASCEGKLEWVEHSRFPTLKMPGSAKHMILHYLHIGQYDSLLYGGVSTAEGASFVPLQEYDD